MAAKDFSVETMGPPIQDNPILIDPTHGYVTDSERVLHEPLAATVRAAVLAHNPEVPSFELAGPRQRIAFDPLATRAAVITCGGICPGLNAVIRAIVMQLWYRYGVRDIVGVRYGYQGLGPSSLPFTRLDPLIVGDIHERGGTILGSSRGAPTVAEMVDSLVANGVHILFTIGGDGTMRGANDIATEIKKRGLKIAIVGIPKTIDNDILYVRRSFGFETAVAIATRAITAAYNEAQGVMNGIGLVKLMGRNSGYIAANTTLATGHVNFCLVPEVPFKIEGDTGLLAQIEKRFEVSDHCVIVVAEGAGQSYFEGQEKEYDSSGNLRMGDIGLYLKSRIGAHFKAKSLNVPIRYIDPSYLIRAAAADPGDALFCAQLAQNAVHAAMAGRTAMVVGNWHGHMTHVPMQALAHGRQAIDPSGDLWFKVIESTGQPAQIGT